MSNPETTMGFDIIYESVTSAAVVTEEESEVQIKDCSFLTCSQILECSKTFLD